MSAAPANTIWRWVSVVQLPLEIIWSPKALTQRVFAPYLTAKSVPLLSGSDEAAWAKKIGALPQS